MKRRDFLRRGIGAGFVAGTTFAMNPYNKLMASPGQSDYDMVAIMGGEPAQMFDRSIEQLGGMRNFVKKGQTVVVKPNIGWDASPERAANTNPALIKRIVEHAFNAGAKEVYVFDHTCNEWSKCYTNSGIEKAAKDAGAKVVMGNSEKYYQDVSVDGVKLKNVKVHELILDTDVFINVPVLKNHGGANLTIAMKNLMGIVWDRGYWHRNDLNQCIADFAGWRKPDLNVIDAYRVMKRNGPRGVSVEDVITMKAQLVGTDMVALDTAATKMFGKEVNEIRYISMAEEAGVGTSQLDNLNISRIKI